MTSDTFLVVRFVVTGTAGKVENISVESQHVVPQVGRLVAAVITVSAFINPIGHSFSILFLIWSFFGVTSN